MSFSLDVCPLNKCSQQNRQFLAKRQKQVPKQSGVIQFSLATWAWINDSPLNLFLILARTEGKFNLAFLGTGQRRLIFTIKKIPAFSVLGPHRKYCQGHINRQAVGKNISMSKYNGESTLICIIVANYKLAPSTEKHAWK